MNELPRAESLKLVYGNNISELLVLLNVSTCRSAHLLSCIVSFLTFTMFVVLILRSRYSNFCFESIGMKISTTICVCEILYPLSLAKKFLLLLSCSLSRDPALRDKL